jgi:hypothetical protein
MSTTALPIIVVNPFKILETIVSYSTLIMAEKQGYVVDQLSDRSPTDDSQINGPESGTLADAILKQKPKLWTKRMLKVSLTLG